MRAVPSSAGAPLRMSDEMYTLVSGITRASGRYGMQRRESVDVMVCGKRWESDCQGGAIGKSGGAQIQGDVRAAQAVRRIRWTPESVDTAAA